jgi:gliding motility-associated-like protein
VKLCGNTKVPSPCNNDLISDKNPYWYKFKCYTSGTLGLLITPVVTGDDYDWQLFDITGKDPKAVYTDKTMFVACNWSGETGNTGASSAGNSLVVCEGPGKPLYSSMPTIIEGHEYLLLISHFTDTQSGYTLSFSGGSADITDPKIPSMERASASCEGTDIFIRLNKPMKCESLAKDGSDFSLPSGLATVVSAASPYCSIAFDTDSIIVTLNKQLAPGAYNIDLNSGSDGNTLLDNCGNEMPAGTISFTVNENVSAAFNYVVKEGCVNDTVHFSHDGLNHVNSWNWDFDIASSNSQNPLMLYLTGGNKNARLIVSNGFCSDTVSAVVSLTEKLNAAFDAPEIACAVDDVVFTDRSTGPINSWQWDFGNSSTSSQQNPEPFKYARNAGEKIYKVILNISSAAGCTDTASANVIVVGNCNINVPSAFTPNNDGRNDYLYPSNAFNADNLIFRIYNRFGQIIFETRDWRRKWDGNVNGQPQSSGTYVWTLSYKLRTTGRPYYVKGTTVLIR